MPPHRAFQSPKLKKRRPLVVVGIGLLASPFPVQSDDEEVDKAPEVSCLWVENHGSIGFTVDFDVTAPSNVDWEYALHSFRLCQDGNPFPVDREDAPRATLKSPASNQGWLSIPGFDGGPPLPYPGYLHSFDFTVKGEQYWGIPLGDPPSIPTPVAISQVSISLYVILNSNGSLHSMMAWAYDSDGDGYEVPVYYSPGGSENFRTFED